MFEYFRKLSTTLLTAEMFDNSFAFKVPSQRQNFTHSLPDTTRLLSLFPLIFLLRIWKYSLKQWLPTSSYSWLPKNLENHATPWSQLFYTFFFSYFHPQLTLTYPKRHPDIPCQHQENNITENNLKMNGYIKTFTSAVSNKTLRLHRGSQNRLWEYLVYNNPTKLNWNKVWQNSDTKNVSHSLCLE